MLYSLIFYVHNISVNDEAHEIVSELKNLTAELGHIPTRSEYLKLGSYTRVAVDRVFGSFSLALAAAGLKIEGRHAERIDNSVFVRPIEQHLEQYKPREAQTKREWPSVAVISDIHFPFCSQSVIDRFYEYVGDVKPDWVVAAGDIWDFLSHSKFPRSHNVFMPRDERSMCLKMNSDLWTKIQSISPKSKCYQLAGNHEARPLKRILEEYPAAEDWVSEMLKKDFSFPGVTTLLDPREYLQIKEDIIVMHGFRLGAGAHKDLTLMNVFSGHSHQGSVTFKRLMDKTIWEINCGFAGDPEGKGLTYTPSKISQWTPGFGALDRLGPRFVSV